MSHWIVMLLGLVEGVTEFLPVSSTGHLLLVEHWLNLPKQPSELFNVVIQSGAVMAVLLAFAGRLRQMGRDRHSPEVRFYVAKLITAFAITAVGGLVLKKLGLKMPENASPVAWATLVGGVVIVGVERWLRGRPSRTDVTWLMAVIIGASQLVAVSFPGTSRSGVSIIAGLVLGLSRPAATEFSFLLGVPTLLAASAYKILGSFGHAAEPHEPWFQILLGTFVAAVTAFFAVKWLLRYVQSHDFTPFGWYRIGLGALILLWPGGATAGR